MPLVILAAHEKAVGHEEAYNKVVLQIRLLQREIRVHIAKLLKEGTLQYRAREGDGDAWLFGSPLNKKFLRPLREQGLHWAIKLAEGETDSAFDSILGAKEESCPLLAGVSLQFKIEGEESWRVYQPVGGDRGKFPQRFAQRLVALLPESSQASRRELAASASTDLVAAREEVKYEELSAAAREAWDGHAAVLSTLKLRIGGRLVQLSNKDNLSTRKALCATIGVAAGWKAPTPCRFRFQAGRDACLASSRFRKVPSSYKLQLKHFSGHWVPIPFHVRSKRGNKDSETNVVVEVFDELQKALKPAANAPAADSARLEGVPHFFQPYQQKMWMRL